MGDLLCMDAEKGTVIWSKNLPKAYGDPVPLWGYADHPVVWSHPAYGERCVFARNDKKSFCASLAKL